MTAITLLLCLLCDLSSADMLRAKAAQGVVSVNVWRIGHRQADLSVAPIKPDKPVKPDTPACSCNGSKRSGDGIGPCICAKNGSCPCKQAGGKDTGKPAPQVKPVPLTRQVVIPVATWCGSCKAVEAEFPALTKAGWRIGTTPDSHFLVLDVDTQRNHPLLQKLDLSSVPQAVCFENGKQVNFIHEGQPITAVTLAELYLTTKPAKFTHPGSIKEHLKQNHSQQLPADFEKLTIDEMLSLHDKLHAAEAATPQYYQPQGWRRGRR